MKSVGNILESRFPRTGMMISLKQQVDTRMKNIFFILSLFYFFKLPLFDQGCNLKKIRTGLIIWDGATLGERVDRINQMVMSVISGSVAIDGNSLITRHFNEKENGCG